MREKGKKPPKKGARICLLLFLLSLLLRGWMPQSGIGQPSTSDATFQKDVLAANTPVVVYFYEDYDSHCIELNRTLYRCSSGFWHVIRCNVADNPKTRAAYHAVAPSLKVFERGTLLGDVSLANGYISPSALTDSIQNLILTSRPATNTRGGRHIDRKHIALNKQF